MIIKLIKNFFIYLIFFILLTTKSYGDTKFFKCPEKITNVIKGQNSQIKKNSEIGTSYIKLSNYESAFKKISIKFKEKDSNKTKKIVTNKDVKTNTLGFEIFEKYSDEKETIENFYTFIKIDKTFAFTKKKYYWTSNNEKDNYEYESSGRCIKISKNEFDAEKKIKKVVKKESKNLTNKTDKNSNFSNIIKGQRTIAITWDGYEELILGKINFSEKDFVGRLEFKLPNNDGLCVGTYALSEVKGTWSIYCKKINMNASGFLKLNNNDGSVTGKGKDNKQKKIKFKIGNIN